MTIAVKLKGINCSHSDDEERFKMHSNPLLNGGCVDIKGAPFCGYDDGTLNTRCKQNQADSAFMFLTVVILIAAVTMTLLHLKRK